MATNFDFDGTFNDDDEGQNAPQEAPDVEEEEQSSGRNPLRLILLGLLVLVLLCVVCFLASRTLGIAIPFIGGGGGAPPPVEEPAEPEAVDATTGDGEEAPAEGEEAPVEGEEAPGDGEEAPAEGEEAPVEGEELPAEGEEAPADGEEAPAEGEEAPVEGEELPAEGEEAPAGGEEAPAEGEEPATDEAAGEEPQPEATEEMMEEPGEEPAESDEQEGQPTAEPEVTVVITPESCEENTPPTADAGGPYNTMMGKGQAFVTFDASASSDSDGTIVEYTWDFGDGSETESSQSATTTHGYTDEGTYEATLTVTDDCNLTDETTVQVTITGPTPSADEDADGDEADQASTEPAATPAAPASPSNATLGFCYRVQRGDTLTGIANFNGLTVFDLARVNNVRPEYFVIAGESLFVPSESIKNGPNAYQAQAGDTFFNIAYQCDIPVNYLAQVNNTNADATLSPGQVVILPLTR